MRIGIGYDVHRLQPGRPLILGGVNIPHSYGLLGHSDADVLAHAIGDALLGAAALGDLGCYFPDDDQQYAGADSIGLLSEIGVLVKKAGYYTVNVDSTIVAQQPRLSPYINDMRQNIAAALQIDTGSVSVKATTTEQLGFEGRELGIGAQAVVLIDKLPDK